MSSIICITCKKSFTTKQSLEYHTKRNVCYPKIKEEFKCIVCDKLFSTKQKLEYHIKNKVCLELIEASDSTLKMHEMYELIRNLQEKVSMLEKENITLKDQLQPLQSSDKKINKDNKDDNEETEEDNYKRLWAMHIKSAEKIDKCKTLFYDDDIHYAMIPTQLSTSSAKTMTIFAMIDIDHNYHPLNSADIARIHRIFKSFGIPDNNPKIRVNPKIFEKCIQHLGISKTTEDDKPSNNTRSISINENFFEKNDEDGDEYFIGTTLKRSSMESFKKIYKDKGEIGFLKKVPPRFLDLWKNSNEMVLKYFSL